MRSCAIPVGSLSEHAGLASSYRKTKGNRREGTQQDGVDVERESEQEGGRKQEDKIKQALAHHSTHSPRYCKSTDSIGGLLRRCLAVDVAAPKEEILQALLIA